MLCTPKTFRRLDGLHVGARGCESACVAGLLVLQKAVGPLAMLSSCHKLLHALNVVHHVVPCGTLTTCTANAAQVSRPGAKPSGGDLTRVLEQLPCKSPAQKCKSCIIAFLRHYNLQHNLYNPNFDTLSPHPFLPPHLAALDPKSTPNTFHHLLAYHVTVPPICKTLHTGLHSGLS